MFTIWSKIAELNLAKQIFASIIRGYPSIPNFASSGYILLLFFNRNEKKVRTKANNNSNIWCINWSSWWVRCHFQLWITSMKMMLAHLILKM